MIDKLEEASDVNGIVLKTDVESFSVDYDATKRLREKMKNER